MLLPGFKLKFSIIVLDGVHHTRQDCQGQQRAAGRVREVDLSGFARSRDQLGPQESPSRAQHHRRQGGRGSRQEVHRHLRAGKINVLRQFKIFLY